MLRRKLLIVLIYLLPSIAFSQTFTTIKPDSITGKIEFSEIVTVDSASSEVLYTRAREWFAKTFVSADAVLQMDDKAAGKLIGKGFAEIDMSTKMTPISVRMFFTLTVSIKDGKYRYVFSDIYYKAYPSQYNTSPADVPAEEIITDDAIAKKKNMPAQYKRNQRYRSETLRAINELSDGLKQAMSKKADGW